jgi:hypothetical protein
MEGRNQKGEQPNATAFTQVSHLFKATFISLPVSTYQLMVQIPARSVWNLSPLAQQLLLFRLPPTFPLSFLSHFASSTSSEKEKTLGERATDKASTTVVTGPKSRMFLG